MRTLLLFSTSLLLAGSTGSFAMTYDDWKASKFTGAEYEDPFVSGEGADPDGDGRINFLEFGLNSDPKVPDISQWPQWSLDGNSKLTLSFPRWIERPGVLYAPQVTWKLGQGWFSGSRYIEEVGASLLEDGTEIVTIRDKGAGPRRVVRLFVATDSDEDGLPDDWEVLLFGNLNEVGAGDYDLDGLSNLLEWEDGGGSFAADFYNG